MVSASLVLLAIFAAHVDARRVISKDMMMSANPGTEKEGPGEDFHEYCKEHGGEGSQVFGSSCMCAAGSGQLFVCEKDGKLGCGKNRRELKKFTWEEVKGGEAPKCVYDPCHKRDAKIVPGPSNSSDMSWVCDCKVQFCHDTNDQPCPKLKGEGFDRAKHFWPECESCECKFAHSAPKVNRNDLFGQECKDNNGEFVNKQCKCAGWSSRRGVCMGRDGKVGGEGCSSTEYFVEEGCLMEDDAMQCPSCRDEPCGKNTNAELVSWMTAPIDISEAERKLRSTASGQYICSCAAHKETYLCFDGDNQPGCPDDNIEGLRWSSGFVPFQCEGCRCSLTDSYDKVSWAVNFKKMKGDRLIYPHEDLCPDRGASLVITRTQDEQSALCGCSGQASRCSCDEGKTFGGDGCETSITFNALTNSQCKCLDMTCSDPGPTEGPGSYYGPGHGSGRTSWLEGDKVQWTCDEGYGIVQNDVYTKVKTAEAVCHNQVFNAQPPKCGSLTDVIKLSNRYQARQFPSGSELKRQFAFTTNLFRTNLFVSVFKRADETEPRTVANNYPLKCGAASQQSPPPIWQSEETLKNSITCTGTFEYKHKAGWAFSQKPASQVELTVVLGQNAHKALVMAAQEKWPGEEPGEWMEVVLA